MNCFGKTVFSKYLYIFFNNTFFFLKTILFIYFRERGMEAEREGEEHQCVVASHAPTTGDLALQPRHVPWLGIEPQPFCSQAFTQSTEPHKPRQNTYIFICFIFYILKYNFYTVIKQTVTNVSLFKLHFMYFWQFHLIGVKTHFFLFGQLRKECLTCYDSLI